MKVRDVQAPQFDSNLIKMASLNPFEKAGEVMAKLGTRIEQADEEQRLKDFIAQRELNPESDSMGEMKALLNFTAGMSSPTVKETVANRMNMLNLDMQAKAFEQDVALKGYQLEEFKAKANEKKEEKALNLFHKNQTEQVLGALDSFPDQFKTSASLRATQGQYTDNEQLKEALDARLKPIEAKELEIVKANNKKEAKPTDMMSGFKSYQAGGGELSFSDYAINVWFPAKRGADNLTQQEARVKNYMETPKFQQEFGSLSAPEQKVEALKAIRKLDIESDPVAYADVAGNTFAIKNIGSTFDESLNNFSQLPEKEQIAVRRYQQASNTGKEYLKEGKGKSIKTLNIKNKVDKVLSLTDDDWKKGAVANTVNTILSMIPNEAALNAMSASKLREVMMSVRGEGLLGDIFFTYLNDVNKGAPSNADMEVMRAIVTGGRNASLNATKTALSSWFNGVIGATQGYYEGNANEIGALVNKAEYKALQELQPYKTELYAPIEKTERKITRTGRQKSTGRMVIQYDDGSVEYK